MNCGEIAINITIQDYMEKRDTIQDELEVFHFCQLLDHYY